MSSRPAHLGLLAAALLIAIAAVAFLGGFGDGDSASEAGAESSVAARKSELISPPERGAKSSAPDRPATQTKVSTQKTDAAGPSSAAAPATDAAFPRRDPNTPLPKTAAGKIDYPAIGLTGKESGAELLATEETQTTAPARYAFALGQRWEVVTYYRQTQAGDGETWSNPIRWSYEVEGETTFGDTATRRIIVRKLAASGEVDSRFPASTFYVSKDDHRLIGADLYEVRGGKGKYTKVEYRPGDGPLRAKGSIVPFDLPPNGAEGRVTSGRELPHLEPTAAKAKHRFPQPGELVGAGEEALSLNYKLPTGGTIRQRWSLGDMTWPVESIGPHRRSYRVR
ncbi:MAG: hypothetical protein JKY65_24765 [Planctomycetes bacterium]|nr:hypothetical protein [Planctomycetota bacterium]